MHEHESQFTSLDLILVSLKKGSSPPFQENKEEMRVQLSQYLKIFFWLFVCFSRVKVCLPELCLCFLIYFGLPSFVLFFNWKLKPLEYDLL